MRPKRGVEGLAAERTPVTPLFASLTLIHRNNCSNPIGMRVTARLEWPEGVDFQTLKKTLDFAFGPLGQLMIRRVSDGA